MKPCLTSLKKNFKVISKTLKNVNYKFLHAIDYIIIDSYPVTKKIIDDFEGISPKILKELCPNVKIIVYFGDVNYDLIKKVGLECYPENNKSIGKMYWTADLLGSKPIIELNALGIKVGELLSKNRLSGMTSRQAELNALNSDFCLDFSKAQRKSFMKDF